MVNLILAIIGFLIGYYLLRQSQKAKRGQKSSTALLWMLGSAFFALFGLCQLAVLLGV